jgi:calcineurin-like phosphoesterase family protein
MMNMWFISDTHFWHDKIRMLALRPFNSLEEMNEAMVSNWNSVVSPSDTVYHLGDFAYGTWKGGNPRDIFDRLNGQKHLIVGNHDHEDTRSLPWQSQSYIKNIRYGKNKIVLCHYPMIEWDGCFHGSYHFHGHTHNVSPLEIITREVQDIKAMQIHHHMNGWPSDHIKSRFEPYYKNWRNVSVEMINYTPQHIDELLKDQT